MELPGLRADSLLGFLAALGVSRSLQTGLAWQKKGPYWIARLDTEDSLENVIFRLTKICQEFPSPFRKLLESDPAMKFEEGVSVWREFATSHPDWAAAIGCESGNDFFRSPILMSRGGGGQHPLEMVRKQCSKVIAEDVEQSLLGPWKRIPKFGLRLDPLENRPHADNWLNPSSKFADSKIVALGPTRLAFEGFPLIPTLDKHTHPLFDTSGKILSWPVWESYLLPRAITARMLTSSPAFVCRRRHIDKGNWSVSPAKAAT